jgi:hypothetical protein
VLPWSSNLRRSTVEPSWRGSLQTSMPVACRSCEEAGSYGGHLETASVPSVDWGLHPALPARTCSGYSTLCRILDRRDRVRPVRLPQDNRCAVADRQPLKGSRQIRWRAGQSQKKGRCEAARSSGRKTPKTGTTGRRQSLCCSVKNADSSGTRSSANWWNGRTDRACRAFSRRTPQAASRRHAGRAQGSQPATLREASARRCRRRASRNRLLDDIEPDPRPF